MNISFNFKLSGAAGKGIKSAGLIFAKTCFDHGLSVHGYTEYPSLIRGGCNTFQIYASSDSALSPLKTIDLDMDLSLLNIQNISALGQACYYFNLSLKILNQAIASTFSHKDKTIIKQNQQLAEAGYKEAKKKYPKPFQAPVPVKKTSKRLFLTANEALALGAVAGGLKLYIAYPMTPATSILHFLASKAKLANLAVRHAEDEIGVANMAVGASFAGVRTMVGTSGGGFSLMTEALGLAGVTETPLVIVNSMRPGPASGMPTWTGQGDLLYVINASQDEFPRLVFTPGDPQETFEAAKLAMNLTEKYQLPAIILLDKYLSESYFTVEQFPLKHSNRRYAFAHPSAKNNHQPFKRYQDTPSGVSLRTIPGQPGGIHLANSYEHDQYGYATEDSIERTKQTNKRSRKNQAILDDPDFLKPVLYGPQKASSTLISWGSNKGIILESLKQIPKVNFIHFPQVWPFPKKSFLNLFKSVTHPITLENNSTGQLNSLIRQSTGIDIKDQILKYDGRPFFPSEVINKLK